MGGVCGYYVRCVGERQICLLLDSVEGKLCCLVLYVQLEDVDSILYQCSGCQQLDRGMTLYLVC